ncbi:hypothetical protein STEG23_029138 [Scotinomys teguina]
MLMAVMLLPGTKGSPLLVWRKTARTIELQEIIDKGSQRVRPDVLEDSMDLNGSMYLIIFPLPEGLCKHNWHVRSKFKTLKLLMFSESNDAPLDQCSIPSLEVSQSLHANTVTDITDDKSSAQCSTGNTGEVSISLDLNQGNSYIERILKWRRSQSCVSSVSIQELAFIPVSISILAVAGQVYEELEDNLSI